MVEAIDIDLLNLLLLLALAWTFRSLAEHVGYPALMGELLAGIVFGPALLGVLHPDQTLAILAELGVFLLMIYVGMEVDVHDLFELGPQALMVAIGGFALPFGLSYPGGGSSARRSNSRSSSASRWRRPRPGTVPDAASVATLTAVSDRRRRGDPRAFVPETATEKAALKPPPEQAGVCAIEPMQRTRSRASAPRWRAGSTRSVTSAASRS